MDAMYFQIIRPAGRRTTNAASYAVIRSNPALKR
jgi:hypothetical protein